MIIEQKQALMKKAPRRVLGKVLGKVVFIATNFTKTECDKIRGLRVWVSKNTGLYKLGF